MEFGVVGLIELIVFGVFLFVAIFVYKAIFSTKAAAKKNRMDSSMSSKDGKNSLSITDKTIKYGSQVYQLNNITQVGKYKANKKRWLMAFFAVIVGVFGVVIATQRGGEVVGLAVIFIAVILLLLSVLRKRLYLLRLETSSGSTELFTSKDEAFIDKLITIISEVMESQIEGTNFIAYTDKSKIINNSNQKIVRGDEVAGDKFDNLNLKNSQIVNRSPNATVTNTISEIYGKEVQNAFESLARHITEHNDTGSSVLLDKIQDEITEKNVDKSKVTALWNSLVRILPEASKVATSIATIAGAIL